MKKIGATALAAAVTVAMCPALALGAGSIGSGDDPDWSVDNPPSAEKNLKQRGAKIDLKKGKWKKFKSGIYGGKLSYKARVTKVETTSAKKKGYKQTKVTIQFKFAKSPTKAQGLKVAKRQWKYGLADENAGITGCVETHIVDYATGENLAYTDNTKGVKAKNTWKSTKQTGKYRYKDAWVTFFKSGKAIWTITYPETFKDLSLCVGAPLKYHSYFMDDREDAWLWYKTPYFKRDIKNYHFMWIK